VFTVALLGFAQLPVAHAGTLESAPGEVGYELIAVPDGQMQLAVHDFLDKGQSRGLVTVSTFWVGKTEVTQALYERVMGVSPSLPDVAGGSLLETKPVQNVTWRDAVIFANTLSELEGLTPCYGVADDGVRWPREIPCDGYRLPTGTEWEYAARAGGDTTWTGTSEEGNVCQYGNIISEHYVNKIRDLRDDPGFKIACDDGHVAAAPVGSLLPNAWGVHDTTGNVWEWIWGGCDSQIEPSLVMLPDSCRGMRGGSYADVTTEVATIAFRASVWSDSHGDNIGIRLVRSVPGGE